MIQRFSTNFGVFSFFFDLLVSFATILLSRLLRPLLSALPFIKQSGAFPEIPPALYALFPFIWVAFLLFFSVYDGKKNLKVIDEFSNLTLASLLAVITLAGLLYFTYRETSRAFFLTYILLNFLFLLLWRVATRALYKQRLLSKDYPPHILIVGAGPVGMSVRDKLHTQDPTSCKFIGFLDDSTEKQRTLPEVLAATEKIRQVIEQQRVDHVIIALPRYAHEKVNQIVSEISDLAVRLSVIPDYFSLSIHHARPVEFAGILLLELRAPALTENQRLNKRIFDVILTLLLLIPFLPLMALIALLILIVDGRPVIYPQRRVGENGQVIRIFKFRTMVVGADRMDTQVATTDTDGNVIFKLKNDPRVTPLGRILRRFSLDELPQFFNVLRGTLSLVGPRPELLHIAESYEPWQRARLSVPQGLTGWWQTQGRSDRPLHLNIEDDLYYIEHYSTWLDLSILIKTVWIVLRGKGAY